jgi:hypothetical protein
MMHFIDAQMTIMTALQQLQNTDARSSGFEPYLMESLTFRLI